MKSKWILPVVLVIAAWYLFFRKPTGSVTQAKGYTGTGRQIPSNWPGVVGEGISVVGNLVGGIFSSSPSIPQPTAGGAPADVMPVDSGITFPIEV